MLLASVIIASIVTLVLFGAGVLWAISIRGIAHDQDWMLAFSMKGELFKTLMLAAVASAPMWINVVFVKDTPWDMPPEYYLPIPAVGLVCVGLYIWLALWHVRTMHRSWSRALPNQ